MMLKKSISLLLCAVLAFSLCTFALPETALAGTPSTGVWVGGTNVTAGGYWLNDASTGGITGVNATADSYNVRYDATTKTLTLNGANITAIGTHTTASNDPVSAAVYASNTELTINLIGTNTLTGGSSSNYSAGVYVSNSALTINGSGTLNATGGNAPYSYGVHCRHGGSDHFGRHNQCHKRQH